MESEYVLLLLWEALRVEEKTSFIEQFISWGKSKVNLVEVN